MIVSVQESEDNEIVRFQGNILLRRHQEVRVHVPYFVYLSIHLGHKVHQFDVVRREIESLSASSFLIAGVAFHVGIWNVTPRTRTHDGRRSLDVVLVLVTQVFHTRYVVIVRTRRDINYMFGSKQFIHGGVVAWCRGGSVDSVARLVSQQQDLKNTSLAHVLAQEFEEVDTGGKSWTEVCFIQFFREGRSQVRDAISVASGISLFT